MNPVTFMFGSRESKHLKTDSEKKSLSTTSDFLKRLPRLNIVVEGLLEGVWEGITFPGIVYAV